ncbi:hypothetical protein RCIP0032_00092 [Klebsiella phage RCIP0032]
MTLTKEARIKIKSALPKNQNVSKNTKVKTMRILNNSKCTALTIICDDLEALHKKLGEHSGLVADIHSELMEDLQNVGYGDWMVHDWNNGTFTVAIIANVEPEEVLEQFQKCVDAYDIGDYL